MSGVITSYGVCVIEAGLLVYLLSGGHAKRVWELVFYLSISLGVGGARTYALHRYGFDSPQYGSCYWATDLLIVLAAYVLVVSFFRRACSHNAEMWHFVRLLLGAVLVGITAVSYFSLASHQDKFFSFFIVQFSQDLYFATLVLTTLLYLMTLKMEIVDERLGMLVCGLGIEFAGPAAVLALTFLTKGSQTARVVDAFIFPLCDIGMILTWFYATARVPGLAKVPRSMVEPTPAYARGSISHF
jgi:hypothetical protein